MRVLFATAAALRPEAGGFTSDLASARYRVAIPAQQLARMGHEVQVASLGPDGYPAGARDAPCDVVVISKSFHAANEALAEAMRARGVKVAVDFCDDHFEHPQLGPHHARLAALADVILASTEAMAAAVRRHAGREAIVVPDPVEGPRRVPAFAPRFPELRMAWFGHPTNLGGLAAKASQLQALARRFPVRLQVVTAPAAQAAAEVSRLAGQGVRAEHIAWSTEATWKALEDADLAWIPVAAEERKQAKSPNRLLETIWAGRLAIADEVPSYMPYADLVPIGRSLEEGVTEALADAAAVESRLREGQRRIARDHSAFACGARWAHALGDTATRPLRLNLGCGDKILPGYVNVDVAEARAGMKPDVLCDLNDLAPFADGSADEILSVHVVEHFWRWEVRDVLREWVRVLKPGGRMVIECPNLASACEAFLQDPARASGEGPDGQRTMWVFYGDPKWRDPLMVHRWGYTPESLAALLAECGLEEVRREPARFKLREPRDMRVVGTKPG